MPRAWRTVMTWLWLVDWPFSLNRRTVPQQPDPTDVLLDCTFSTSRQYLRRREDQSPGDAMDRPTFRVYGYRWVVLAVFMFINITIQMLWISYSPVSYTHLTLPTNREV